MFSHIFLIRSVRGAAELRSLGSLTKSASLSWWCLLCSLKLSRTFRSRMFLVTLIPSKKQTQMSIMWDGNKAQRVHSLCVIVCFASLIFNRELGPSGAHLLCDPAWVWWSTADEKSTCWRANAGVNANLQLKSIQSPGWPIGLTVINEVRLA